ncbi:outer membrane protein assembly factor BamB [Alteromonas oceanisediminis]|uniref:outer membrane protein assembly factor BamB n=1 Tax=Alteromonas oceanisediminis TaxID=2836180 RepID=UPI001BD91F35|nr:outer membrane protein assembly factor BamB [Alteromonas oceanisediminis]MBT0585740.1 outer membrane protein assembly factor BamB [Alteromonas oceanisediminis]
MLKQLALVSAIVTLAGCSTISDWFADEEELEIRRLEPIDAQFQPELIWDRDIGHGVDHYFSRLRPAVAYDKVYVANRHGDVRALDKETGKRVWARDFSIERDRGFLGSIFLFWTSGISAKISGGMTVVADTAYLGTEDGLVYALNAETGETKWQTDVRGEVLSAPAVDSGIVVINTGAGSLLGLSAADGQELWRYDTEVPPLSLRGISNPVATNGGAIVGTPTGKLQVNILESGLVAWEQVIATPSGATELERIVDIDSQPIVFGGTVYTISYDGTLAAVELRSGRVVWKREYASYQSVALVGNALFVVDNGSNVYAIDRRNGVELWSQGRLKGRNLTGAEPMGEYIVIGDNYGYLHWLEQATGTIVARFELGDDDEDEAVYVTPVADGNTVYATTRDGVIAALRVAP